MLKNKTYQQKNVQKKPFVGQTNGKFSDEKIDSDYMPPIRFNSST